MGTKRKIKVLAIDLEGTLISDVQSVIPRFGLRTFLEFCRNHFERLIIISDVDERIFRKTAVKLSDLGCAPLWFENLEYVKWNGAFKDLELISDASPGRNIDN